jgi:hypothetical protein
MTRDEAKNILEQGKTIIVAGVWYYTKHSMDCYEGCCNESFSNIEECLDYLEGDLDEAEVM